MPIAVESGAADAQYEIYTEKPRIENISCQRSDQVMPFLAPRKASPPRIELGLAV